MDNVYTPLPGVFNYMYTLRWTGAINWRLSKKHHWWFLSKPNIGWYKKYDNLNLVMIRNAGHFIATDQPRTAFQALK